MKLRLLSGAVAALAVFFAAVPTALAASKQTPTTHYYLALGDSLSVGYQPNTQGVGQETNVGYSNDLLAIESKHVRNLQLVEMGCPGDTTTSMLTGQGNAASAAKFHCDRSGGSQLKAAEKFLKAHHKKGEVALVTIDIGANDVEPCATGPSSQLGPCVANGENTIKTNTPKILDGIKAAAAKGTALAAMNLYDPVLGEEYFSTNPSDKALGPASVGLVQSVNNDIDSANASAGFKTADVADAFDTYDQTTMVTWEGQQIPIDVANICAWTWACSTPPVGPNIHANYNGYQVIANTFAKVIGRL